MKRILFILFTIFSLFIIKNLVVSIYTLWQKQDLITQAQGELQVEQEKNKRLSSQLSLAKSPGFVEEQIRNKLFLVKSREQQVLIPKSLLAKQGDGGKTEAKSNWEQWMILFF